MENLEAPHEEKNRGTPFFQGSSSLITLVLSHQLVGHSFPRMILSLWEVV